VNLEDSAGKIVGRRRSLADPQTYGLKLQSSFGRAWRLSVRRGAYRFRSFEEADQWLMHHLTRKPES